LSEVEVPWPLSLTVGIGILEVDREAELLDSACGETDPLRLCSFLTYWSGLSTLERRVGSANKKGGERRSDLSSFAHLAPALGYGIASNSA
jgi:hypothetical protein